MSRRKQLRPTAEGRQATLERVHQVRDGWRPLRAVESYAVGEVLMVQGRPVRVAIPTPPTFCPVPLLVLGNIASEAAGVELDEPTEADFYCAGTDRWEASVFVARRV